MYQEVGKFIIISLLRFVSIKFSTYTNNSGRISRLERCTLRSIKSGEKSLNFYKTKLHFVKITSEKKGFENESIIITRCL